MMILWLFLGHYIYANGSATRMNQNSSNTFLEAGTTPGTNNLLLLDSSDPGLFKLIG